MPKKTKAQLEEERLQREEEERKAKLAEEKRQAEEAERKRLEDMRIQEERRMFRETELERLRQEQSVWRDDTDTRQQRLSAEENHEAAKQEWDAYRNPKDDFESMSERDMNTFLSLTEESRVPGFKQSFELAQTIQQVGASIDQKWSDALLKRRHGHQISAEENCKRCLAQINDKIDMATAHVLRLGEANKLDDRAELKIEECSSGVSVGIWGSYADIRPIRKSVQFEQLGVQIDVPKQILQHDANFLFKVTRIWLDPFSIAAYRPSTEAPSPVKKKYVVGDLITVEILRTPPPAFNLRAKKWVIRDRSAASQTLQKSTYPSSVNSKALFKVPDEVAMSDDVTVMVWDEEIGDWTDEGISDYQYIEASGAVQLYLTVVGTFAFVKSRAVDFPYKKWSLQPIRNLPTPSDVNAISRNYEVTTRFSVQTPRGTDVVIDIVGTKVKLVRPNTKYLADLIGVEMPTGSLLKALLRRGVNILPVIPPNEQELKKDSLLEDVVLRHIARNACSFDFEGSSFWNDNINRHQIGLHARESTAFAGGLDSFNMECILAEVDEESLSHNYANQVGTLDAPGIKFSLVMGNEYGKNKQQFSHTLRPDEVSHYELAATMQNRITPETAKRIKGENVRFEKTVYEFLSLVRPFSFS